MSDTDNIPPQEKCIVDNFGGRAHPYAWCIIPVDEMVPPPHSKANMGLDLTADYVSAIFNYGDGLACDPSKSVSRDCSGILGNKYVLKTTNMCTEVLEDGTITENERIIHKYINNVSDGANILTGGQPSSCRGIIPAAMGAAGNIRVDGIMRVFMGGKPMCKKANVKCHLVDSKNQSNSYDGQSGHVYIDIEDIKLMKAEDFVSGTKPSTYIDESTRPSTSQDPSGSDGFANMFKNIQSTQDESLNNIYYISLTLLFMFIMYKIIIKNKK